MVQSTKQIRKIQNIATTPIKNCIIEINYSKPSYF